MRVLLDTHAFLWFILNDPQLSAPAKSVIEDPANDVVISPRAIGRLPLRSGWENTLYRGRITHLSNRRLR
jgi:PIN domain nuclease of toxin-antitoxin system